MRLRPVLALSALASCLNVASAPDGIRAIDERHFVIDRGAFAAAHPYEERPCGVITPAIGDAGTPIGFRISRLRPDGLCTRLGLHDGDVLTVANGEPLATPDMALSAYSRLREENEISLTVLRDGRPLMLDYSVE